MTSAEGFEGVKPLDGVRIVDFTRQMSGPYASMALGDYGADVIKVESMPEGDPARGVGSTFIGDVSALFLTWNRNKRSISVDMRTPEGLTLAKSLIATADVVMENYRPGVAASIGIGWGDVKDLNPRLIYCSTNAFGSKGPWKDLPGTDPVVQAMSGVMSVTGEPDGGPNLVGIPLADYVSSMQGVQAVLLALAAREKTGRGQFVEVSMLASVIAGLTTRIAPYFLTGENPGRFGSQHSQVVPYQAFKTADGYAVAGVWGRGWPQFCDALDYPELAEDERFLTNLDRVARREELVPILNERFVLRTTAEWETRFRDGSVLFSPVNTFSDVLESEQAAANELFVQVEHPTVGSLRQIAPSIKMSETAGSVRMPPPLLGQHSREIMRELGIEEADIATLIDSGVVLQADDAILSPSGSAS